MRNGAPRRVRPKAGRAGQEGKVYRAPSREDERREEERRRERRRRPETSGHSRPAQRRLASPVVSAGPHLPKDLLRRRRDGRPYPHLSPFRPRQDRRPQRPSQAPRDPKGGARRGSHSCRGPILVRRPSRDAKPSRGALSLFERARRPESILPPDPR